ncbi:MAG: DUF4115 domain-containing protein [Halieaceae bacterium]|nr:DUF4115 domain-containing protein [Halieaceae bacterium]
MENSESPAEVKSTPGRRLREAREAAGISPREMADRLNWLPAQFAAIEDDRFDDLRGAAFVRGYLRAYARAVELDEDEMVELYAALHPEQQEPAGQATAAPPASAISQPTGMSIGLGVAVAVIVIGAIWFKQEGTEEPPPQSEQAVAETATGDAPTGAPAEVEAEVAEEPEVDTAAPAEPAVDLAASAAAADQPVAPVALVETETEPEIQRAQPEVTELAAADPPPAEAEDVAAATSPVVGADGDLQFSFSGDCWLEVRDGEGQLIYADLKRAGDTLGLDGIPPFEILAGDAATVTLLYQGEPVAIRTRPGRDTARFTVGEP